MALKGGGGGTKTAKSKARSLRRETRKCAAVALLATQRVACASRSRATNLSWRGAAVDPMRGGGSREVMVSG